MVSTLDSHAQRVASELSRRQAEAEAEPEPAPPPPPRPALPWGWISATLAAAVALLIIGLLYWQAVDTAREVDAARNRLQLESAALRATLDEVRAAQARQAASPPLAAPATAPIRDAPRPLVLRVPLGEAWLAGSRLDALRNTVGQLERSGFQGTVRLELHAGQFCLAGEAGGAEPAPEATPVTKCAVGNPVAEQLGWDRAPLAFVNLAATVASRTQGGIQLQYVRGAAGQEVAAYPGSQATAGQWNAAAEANNRIEIAVIPR